MPLKINLAGKKFGMLLVLCFDHFTHDKRSVWKCRCDCGKIHLARSNNLTHGKSIRSCGCYVKQHRHEFGRKHGFRNTPEYEIWHGMKQRCHNPRFPFFKNYGGRGISVCARWRKSFVNFLSDMGKRPTPKHSINRIDNNGNYSPRNCEWSTVEVQASNRRNNINVEHNGVVKCLAQWAKSFGKNPATLYNRFKKGITPPNLFK